MLESAKRVPGAVVFDNARGHLAEQVPKARPEETAGQILSKIAGHRYDCATDVAICEDGRLVGLLPLERLLAAPAEASARELMDSDPPAVDPAANQEVAAWKAVQHGESSLAVVDADHRFLGLIPARRLLAVLLREHHEDMARLGGLLRGALQAKTPLQEAIPRRLIHRLPWLALGLAGAVVSADLVGSFEHTLRANVMLAFFLPGIVYLADAVGTQTETLIVRGLSVRISIGRVIWRELASGTIVGVILGAMSIPLILWRWGGGALPWIVACSIVGACTVATLVGVLLPWLLHRLRLDPAFGTGPLSTVIQDLLSILIYFLIAALLLR